MQTTCLINNFNYKQFVGEAVESARTQSHAFEKIVVVDDGSTDGSVNYLRSRFANDERVVVISKDHGGQLSCFNRGMDEVDTELVFFLDADDRYFPNYVETAVSEYRQRPDVDFLGVASRVLTDRDVPKYDCSNHSRDLGISVVGATLASHWIGEKTSCISMRTDLARKVLPFPNESDWITRADDVLVLGSSIMGGFKRYLAKPLVDYRIHQHNHFKNRTCRNVEKIRRSLAINRLCKRFADESGYELNQLPRCIQREFRTRQTPSLKEWLSYQKLAFGSNLPLLTCCKYSVGMSWHYVTQLIASLPTHVKQRQKSKSLLSLRSPTKAMTDAA